MDDGGSRFRGRDFLKPTAGLAASLTLAPLPRRAGSDDSNESERRAAPWVERPFEISLAEWSLYRACFDRVTRFDPCANTLQGPSDRSPLAADGHPLEFPAFAGRAYAIAAVEYVDSIRFDRAKDQAYLRDSRGRG